MNGNNNGQKKGLMSWIIYCVVIGLLFLSIITRFIGSNMLQFIVAILTFVAVVFAFVYGLYIKKKTKDEKDKESQEW